MEKFNKNSILTALAVFFVLGLTGPVTVFAATSPILTGSTTYSVLGHSTVTNTGLTTTTGEVGVSTGTAITNFPPGVAGGDNTIHLHSNDLSAQAAQSDNVAAFSTLNQGCDHSYADGQDLFLLSPLGPGVYCSPGSFALSGHLTLTGSGVWIFKSGTTLITSTSSSVTGGDPCNIWWSVGSSATLGTSTSFEGNILALASITLDTSATLNGRAMAQTGAVALDTNHISGPTCASTATLRVIKHVVNNNGGTLLAGNFSTTITGVTTATPTAAGVEAGVDNIVTSFGVYGVDEGVYVGYDKTLSGGCSGTIGAGDTKICTITNDDQAPHLIVVKHVVNDNGGALLAGNFSTTITGVTTAVPTAVGVEGGVDNILTSVGAYSVDEGAHVGYDKTLDAGCLGTIAIGETKTCTITNDDQAPHLIVVKHVVNDDNTGVSVAGNFSTTITGVATAVPTAAGVEAGVDNILTSVGVYSVDEGAHVGYAKTLDAGCSGTIAIGETKTCTITNNDIVPVSSTSAGPSSSTGTINVVKLVINDNGGTKTVSDFPLFVNATLVTSGATNRFSANSTYTVYETSNPKYAATFSGDCDVNGHVNLGPNENKFCIITNNDIGPVVAITSAPPIIDLVKVPSPLALPGGPGPVTYVYTLRNIGLVPVTNITMVGDSCAPINLVSGDLNNDSKLDVNETWLYRCSTTLSETHTNTVVATGWAGGISATDIASATVVVGSSVVPPLIHVTKIPSPIALPVGGGMVTYTD